MAVTVKKHPKDPLDLIKSQKATSDDVSLWIHAANKNLRMEREALEKVTDVRSVAAHLIRQRMEFWSGTVDRLLAQRDLMTRG